jgi:hypothetical protein
MGRCSREEPSLAAPAAATVGATEAAPSGRQVACWLYTAGAGGTGGAGGGAGGGA